MLRTCGVNISKSSSPFVVVEGLCRVSKRNVSSTSKGFAVAAALTKERQTSERAPAVPWNEAKPYSEIPGPRSTLKSMLRFLPGGMYYKRPLKEINRLMREEYGDVILFKGSLGKDDVVILFNPKDFEQVYRMEGIWPNRRGFDTFDFFRRNIRSDLYEDNTGLLNEQGEKWRELRGKVNPVMMQPRIAKQYVKPVEDVADEFITRIIKLRDSNNELPSSFNNELNKWSLESIARIALDARLGCLKDDLAADSDPQKMIQSVHDFFDLTFKLEFMPSIWRYVKTPAYYRLMKALETMTSISLKRVDEAMERLKNAPEGKSDQGASVLEKLLKIDHKIAIMMSMDMLLAGVDTTSYTTGILLHFLSTNQRAQHKLREEILTILPEKDSKLNSESFNHVPYLRACMKEANRILPIAGGTMRKIPVDIVVGGYQIPKGSDIALNHMIPSMDEQQYPNPKEYLPERWLSRQDSAECPSAKSAHPFVYMPFGFGPRSCIGRRFAELEMEVLVVKLLRNYKLEWNYGELEFVSKLLTTPTTPFRFKVTEI